MSDGFSRVHVDLTEGRVRLPSIGKVVPGPSALMPWQVLDGAGREVEPIGSYLRDRLIGDVSPLTCRSYAFDLLRWFRVMWAVDVGWEQATEAETAALVGWLRAAQNPQRKRKRRDGLPVGAVNPKTGKPIPAAGYAPATIAHNLSAVHGFYAFHLHFGRGPAVNPVPENRARRAALAHVSPLEQRRAYRRGRLRPKVPQRQSRAIPDHQWHELFSGMRCTRDRALLACYVSSGARASELLGIRLSDIDWHGGKLWVVSKGSRLRQAVPVSPDALAYLAAYFDEVGLPTDGGPVWCTRRGEVRPLTYWAARRIIQRAAELLGMNWTLHDLRHTAATRMVRDPGLTLVDVQTILRHAHVTTTALYTVTGLDDLIDKLAEHYQRPAQQTRWAVSYDADDIAAVFGGQ
ncbi:tyrosine-type recombinase/integrase [Nocardia vinacea]|uniref:tyrosine-type recombinase/integrase n=1 Tax=Nocardia vinacea TaxID=96468 RepID=UPI00068574A2|nr:tyrosine-type recombinase/integrase [Nocardia vinacea]